MADTKKPQTVPTTTTQPTLEAEKLVEVDLRAVDYSESAEAKSSQPVIELPR